MRRRRTTGRSLFVNVLGGFQAAGPHPADVLLLERKKARALLAMLALDPRRMVPRGKITTLLWSELSEDAARHALRQCVLDLRQTLAKANIIAIRTEADLIGLEAARVIVDVARFEHQVTQGTPAALEEAVALYRGDLLEGFSVEEPAFEDWLRLERERLRSQAVRVLKNLLAHHVREKVADAAIPVAIRLLAFEPFDEAVHRTLMHLYSETGRRSAALRQYEECVEILSRELGVEPEADTRELYRRLVSERARPSDVPVAAETHRRRISKTLKAREAFRSIVQTPLIGRELDLEWLDSFSQRAYQGQPQLLLVVGEAGIGKSRLVAELAVRTRRHRAEILVGRGREGESVLPFAPWVEALRPALGEDLVGHLPPTTRRDLARLFSELDDGASPPPGGLEDGPRIFEAVAQLLRQLAHRHPLAVVIEDLHWCDDMTVRLLRFLPRRLEGQPVLLMGTARPEEMSGDAGREAVLDTLSHDPTCISRTLGPLSRSETTQLFRTLLASRYEGPPETLVERTWTLSEGNPFVVVECARAARDRGAAGPDSWFELPNQVRALTARCFTNLSDRAARLADVAAVIGRDFDAAVLRHATGLAESEVADGVEELVRRHILREVDGRFDFGHDRVREVGYARLLGPRRALLHRQVGEALEATYAADLASHLATIGTHYRQAGVWEEACKYLARAGFQAWQRGAGREALTCFEDALQAIARLPDNEEQRARHVHLRLVSNGASAAIGSYDRGRPHLLAAQNLAATLSDRCWAGRVAAALSNSYRAATELGQALRLGEFALKVAEEMGDRGLESAARFVLAYSEFTVGNFRRSVDHMPSLLSDDARCPGLEGPFLPYVDKPGWMRTHARYLIVLNYVQLGEFDVGMRLVADSLKERDPLDDPLGTSRMITNISLGKLHNGRGDFDAAVRAYEAALAIYREDCHGNYYRPLGWGLGLAYALAGRVGEGVELLERADAAHRNIGSNTLRPMLLLHLGRALIESGRVDDAAQSASEALKLAREGGNRLSEAGALGLLAEVARRREPVPEEEMKHYLLSALALADQLEMRPLAARCHLRLAWLCQRTGRPESDRHAATAALLLEQMGKPRSLDAAGVH
jgi:DNA-binding SARP family transcriptional activator/tetratricopeptide (TPR) repeat protein